MSKTESKGTAKEPKHVIYCGSSLRDGTLHRYALFTDGIPPHLSKHIEACPAIKKMFVPVEKLSATDAAIREHGTPESVFFQQTADYAAGKRVEE
ncbi:hypothetical protein SD939_10395 [Lactobacillus crispatus]|uniref:hypothetical protein n=1 Tax=Lactobacillus crispatus TaxID=47770 RepID=UPI0029C3E76C|nr:hypothetical protein [Lactobacillus crispatus]MDX5091615.1 hypothetical protein [Lactobacillus crispatus]